MSHFHAVIWIDHKEARIFHFNAEDADKLTLKAHHARSVTGREDEAYLHEVAKTIAESGEVLVTGPAKEKMALLKHIAKHDPSLLSRIIGVESADHPSDGQILAHARAYFKNQDRKTTQKV